MSLQHGYSEAFKLQVVREVESGTCSQSLIARRYGIRGHSTILKWRRKYGNGKCLTKRGKAAMPQNSNQELHLQNEIKELKRELEESRIRNVVLETLVDVADRELGTNLRKKCGAKHVQKRRV